MPAALTGAEKVTHLLTRHTALSYPALREALTDPERVKRVSGIDRLGNLSSRTVSHSLVMFRLGSFLTTPNRAPALSEDIRESLAAELRRLITTRQHLMIALVPATHVEDLQEFFGANSAEGVGVAPGEPLLQALSSSFRPEDLHVIKNGTVPPELAERYTGKADEPHVVVGLSPSAWLRTWSAGTPEQRHFVSMAFTGADSSTISSRNYHALQELGAKVIPSSRLYRALHSPKFWAYVIVFIYSTLRALPVTFVENFHGSVTFLWAMDVITALPYTWGLVAFFTAHKPWVRLVGLAVTLFTFMAPYIYFWSHGQDYSWWVNAIVVAMIAGAILYEGANYLRDRAVARGLFESHL